MEDLFSNNKTPFSLFELNNIIKNAISDALPDTYWVMAEIADTKLNQKGHCYLELVEKEDNKTVAQAKANIWAYEYRKLSLKFQTATNESLKPGMKVLLLAAVNFHEVYGLSLNVRDIDPAYTMGEMALKKREVIERLRKEGLIGLNKSLSLPIVPQKIAVISSPTAAGYGDFFGQLDNNPYGYKFIHVLFPALMQGAGAEQSIISALKNVGQKKDRFDVLVIIRGGGSVIDLDCFDSYNLALQIAKFPMPVITGIGHEKDDTVVDMTAHTKMKTPTAVAEFLISGLRSFEETVIGIQNRVVKHTERFIRDENYGLTVLAQRLSFISIQLTASLNTKIDGIEKVLRINVRQFIQKAGSRLDNFEKVVRLLDPVNVLQRGYSITQHKGKILKDASLLCKGDVIVTSLFKGIISSVVENTKEAEEYEQEQAVDLFSGID
ncbi:MAG: exodeoxyribonuclease VII large subunit [Nitrospira bacterium HGW-Nitrospira-1]|nr:MAG: exodeoxyribonuclease VII large subunit [Nitrospira bacterium HGW-Nitrospira-1]